MLIHSGMQAQDSLSGAQVALKILELSEMSPMAQHSVIKGCRVHACCTQENMPHVLQFYSLLRVCCCITAGMTHRCHHDDSKPGGSDLHQRHEP
jgi:hypothetical protein